VYAGFAMQLLRAIGTRNLRGTKVLILRVIFYHIGQSLRTVASFT